MEIKIFENDIKKLKLLKEYLLLNNISIVGEDLEKWFSHNNTRAIVTTSLEDGTLVGDYSLSIDDIFNGHVSDKVMGCVDRFYNGKQLLGSSFISKIPNSDKYVINTAISKENKRLEDTDVIYQSMRTSLLCAYANNMESVLYPIIGAGLDCDDTRKLVEMMYSGYMDTSMNPTIKKENEYDVKKLIKTNQV